MTDHQNPAEPTPRAKEADVHPLLTELQDDHRHLDRMLDLLEHEVGTLRRGALPHYPLIQEIVAYLCEFPDRVHHPREDLMYQRMACFQTGLNALLETVVNEHARLQRISGEFGGLLRRAIEQGDVPREAVVHAGYEFVKHHRSHIRREEREIYPCAEALLDEADWRRIAELSPDGKDPLDAMQGRSRYPALRVAVSLH
jgi:hemerythrin-like domain-containing protein